MWFDAPTGRYRGIDPDGWGGNRSPPEVVHFVRWVGQVKMWAAKWERESEERDACLIWHRSSLDYLPRLLGTRYRDGTEDRKDVEYGPGTIEYTRNNRRVSP